MSITSPCPFCGSGVRAEVTLDGMLFNCQNTRRCGAVVRFESDRYADHPEEAMKAFARSSPREHFLEAFARHYGNGGSQP